MAKEKGYREYLTPPIRSDRKPLIDLLPLKQPLRILIDPCDICNFRCKFCFQSKKDFKGSKMTMEVFDIVLEQLMEFEEPVNVVHMYGLGEPLLNENLPSYIAKLKKNKVAKEVSVTSNGSMLTKDLSWALIAAGLDKLLISLNGVKDEHFKNIANVYVDFEKLYQEIRYFYENKGTCYLHVKINGDDYSEEDKEEFVTLFRDCADSINIDHVVNAWPGIQITEDMGNTMYEIQGGGGICPQMFYEILIHSDGSVSPCCADHNYKYENIGNIKTNSIKEIWNGSQLMQMRRQMITREKNIYAMCNHCTYATCAATVDLTSYQKELLKKFGC